MWSTQLEPRPTNLQGGCDDLLDGVEVGLPEELGVQPHGEELVGGDAANHMGDLEGRGRGKSYK